jgi:ankyrin repeat protein
LKSLVQLGTKALPALLEHLQDDRPTKINLTHPGGFGGMFIAQDDQKAAKNGSSPFGGEARYTVMVGDLCYVAIGQIVNRDYSAVQYQPTAIVLVNSVPRLKKLREEVIKQWRDLTPEKHMRSLARDLEDTGHEHVRNGASLRLAYYYPAALEPLALKELARPSYSVFAVEDLIRNRLYPAKTAKERQALVSEFANRHGEIAREGIRWMLFQDLETQEADEQGRLSPGLDPRHRARECLVDVFGLPVKVTSNDRPPIQPLDGASQVRFVQTLLYDQSKRLDRAVRDVLAKTDNDYLAKSCLDRLVGRGFDADIEAYHKRRLPQLHGTERDELRAYKHKLGWTRLHAAVQLDVVELVQRALKEKVPVNARGRDGRTALHIAATAGQLAIAEILLNAGADPNIKNDKGRLPVQLAARDDQIPTVRLLVARGSNVPDVLVAASVGSTDSLAAMLENNRASLKATNSAGLTALHIAAREGHAAAVRALLSAGADVNAVDQRLEEGPHLKHTNGWSPLHLAVMANKTAIAEILLQHGANVNAADHDGKRAALHLAVAAGNAELVRLLLSHKADRDARDEGGRTALRVAKEQGNTAVIALLER